MIDNIDSMSDQDLIDKINDISRKFSMASNPQVRQTLTGFYHYLIDEREARRARAKAIAVPSTVNLTVDVLSSLETPSENKK